MASAFAKSQEFIESYEGPAEGEAMASEARLGKAFSLLEYKVQQLVARQHQELTRLHLRLQEAQSMAEEIADDLFFQADIEKEKATIKAELEAVNAREYEIRSSAVSLLKSLGAEVRGTRVVMSHVE